MLLFVLILLPFTLTLHSSKHELDTQEFMFFLTGGVGLENKVSALYTTGNF